MIKQMRVAIALGMAVAAAGVSGISVDAQSVVDTQPPSAPVLAAASQSPGGEPSVRLVWNAAPSSQGVVQYVILRNGLVVDSVAPSAGDTAERTVDVEQRGANWFQVQAVDAAGNESRRSAPLRAWVEIGNPPVPRNVTPSLNEVTHCFDLFLTTTPGIYLVENFEVFVNGDSVALLPGHDLEDIDPGGTFFERPLCIDSLLNSGRKYFQVRAISASGASVLSAPVRRDVVRPYLPTGFVAEIVGDQVTFSWDLPEANGYTYVITDALEGVVDASAEDLTITVDLPPSKTGDGRHWFQVQAVDYAGFLSFRTSPLALTEQSPT